jgi:PIN domain nuclease of toxin-antitoxin system
MDRSKLTAHALAALNDPDNDIHVSVATAWEIAIKVGNGKWPEAADLITSFERRVEDAGFEVLPISVDLVRAAGLMNSQLRDPFDRLLAAQAIFDGLTLVTVDMQMATLGATVLWE